MRQISLGARHRTVRRALSILLVLALTLATCLSHADEPRIVPLAGGAPAPWAGVLLNPPAVAQISVDLERAHEECALRVEREVSLLRAEDERRAAEERATARRVVAELEAGKGRAEGDARALRDRLRVVEARPGPYLWMGLGALGGVVTTVVTVLVVSLP